MQALGTWAQDALRCKGSLRLESRRTSGLGSKGGVLRRFLGMKSQPFSPPCWSPPCPSLASILPHSQGAGWVPEPHALAPAECAVREREPSLCRQAGNTATGVTGPQCGPDTCPRRLRRWRGGWQSPARANSWLSPSGKRERMAAALGGPGSAGPSPSAASLSEAAFSTSALETVEIDLTTAQRELPSSDCSFQK